MSRRELAILRVAKADSAWWMKHRAAIAEAETRHVARIKCRPLRRQPRALGTPSDNSPAPAPTPRGRADRCAVRSFGSKRAGVNRVFYGTRDAKAFRDMTAAELKRIGL